MATEIMSVAGAARFDDRPTAKRVGLILLATDHTSERDFARVLVPLGVSVHCNRVPFSNPTTVESLRRMMPRLSAGAALILPQEALDAVYYACTAASMVIGDPVVIAAIQAAKPAAPVVTPTLAAQAAFAALGLGRIALLAPYSRAVTEEMAAYFIGAGLEIARAACFELADDREMARLTLDSIVDAAARAIGDGDEALFIACTAVRGLDAVDRIERRIGRPVVTSNQAALWQILHLIGERPPQDRGGRLMRVSPALTAANVA